MWGLREWNSRPKSGLDAQTDLRTAGDRAKSEAGALLGPRGSLRAAPTWPGKDSSGTLRPGGYRAALRQ